MRAMFFLISIFWFQSILAGAITSNEILKVNSPDQIEIYTRNDPNYEVLIRSLADGSPDALYIVKNKDGFEVFQIRVKGSCYYTSMTGKGMFERGGDYEVDGDTVEYCTYLTGMLRKIKGGTHPVPLEVEFSLGWDFHSNMNFTVREIEEKKYDSWPMPKSKCD